MILDELATHLQSAGVGTISSTLFKGSLPLDGAGTPDAVVALLEVPGLPPVRTLASPPSRYEQPVVQVVVRGAQHGYAAARQQAQLAWEALDGLSNTTLSGVRYLWIACLQSPFLLRIDQFDRPVLVFTVRCARSL